MPSVASCIRIALIASCIASRALAGDWYVDALSGNNSNSGTSPATAWRTISHAIGQVSTGNPERIHVAAGTYDAALGETFPIFIWPRQQLLGAGVGLATIDGGGSNVPLVNIHCPAAGFNIGMETLVSGFTLRNASYGVILGLGIGFNSPLLEYVEVRGMSSAGVAAFGYANMTSYGQVDPTLRDVTVAACSLGLQLSGAAQAGGAAHASVERSSFSGNSADGVLLSTTQSSIALKSCTLAYNGGVGIHGLVNSAQTNSLSECLLYGNADDVALPAAAVASYCDIGDGDFAGSNGNFSADPLFVAPAQQDYRLRVGSPCIDAGDPAQALDADCSRSDVGAFENASPQTYCTAKLNSCGGTPAIGWSGASSASASAGFVVHATGTKGLKPGLLLYGDQGSASVPFSGGTLCIAPAIRRSSPLQDTTGTAGACNGVLAIDMNAFAHGLFGGSPLPNLLTPGTRFYCQFWGRDTIAQTLLSDALEFVVCP